MQTKGFTSSLELSVSCPAIETVARGIKNWLTVMTKDGEEHKYTLTGD